MWKLEQPKNHRRLEVMSAGRLRLKVWDLEIGAYLQVLRIACLVDDQKLSCSLYFLIFY